MIELHGTTWDHPRGVGGFNAGAAAYASYLRPRYPGYVGFQDQAFDVVYRHLNSAGDRNQTLDELDRLYRASRQTAVDEAGKTKK